MKYLVTGGSGFIGTSFVSHLLSNGHVPLNLDLKSPKNQSHIAYWQRCDIRNYEQLRAYVGQFAPDYVVNLAADLGMYDASIEEFNTNTLGVENVVRVCNEMTSVKRIVYVSSLLVCRNGHVPTSFDDYCPPNVYGESKVVGEKIVKDLSSCDRWIIVRPTSVWGPGFEYSYRKFFKAVYYNYYFQPGAESLTKPICFVDNASYMLDKLLHADTDVCKNYYYLLDYPSVTTKEWSDAIRSAFNRRGSAIVLPIWMFKVPALIGDIFQKAGVRDPIFSSFRLRNMLTGATYPVEELAGIVGELPYDLRSGVSRTIAWMKAIGDIK